MYICWKCGDVVEELPSVFDRLCENGGELKYDDRCHCGGDFVEAQRCEECGEVFPADELENGYCRVCLEHNASVAYALEIGAENEENGINGFISWYFGDDLQATLMDYVMNDPVAREAITKAADEYCMEDSGYFAEFLARKRNGNA